MSLKTRLTSSKHEFYYHCVSRIVAGEPLFGEPHKAVFRSMMLKVADFCGVDVLTYCVMTNHIHILCRVPPAEYTQISDHELLRRYRILFSNPSQYRPYDPDVLETLLLTNSHEGMKARQLLLNRMHDLSMFMKILKLRFSIWFNKTHNRFGTLWAEKFKSIVVEGRGNPLLRMAQYIDLNPVRAGISESSVNYPFCGIAAARQGFEAARKGIEVIARLTCPSLPNHEAISWYENQLAETLRQKPGNHPHSHTAHDCTVPFPNPLLLTDRQEKFSKSLAMGSDEFLRMLMDLFRPAFSPWNITHGPRKEQILTDDPVFFGRKERRTRS